MKKNRLNTVLPTMVSHSLKLYCRMEESQHSSALPGRLSSAAHVPGILTQTHLFLNLFSD